MRLNRTLPIGETLVVSTAIGLSAFTLSAPARAVDCEGLKTATIANTTIVSAEAIPVGGLIIANKAIPAGDLITADKVTRDKAPAFCRVVASVKSRPDSDIRIELWLPKEGWNGAFVANGSGGYGAGLAYNYPAMEVELKRGYAAAETDMGTAPSTSLSGDAIIGHPQKWKDWGILSTHVLATVGKEIEKAYFNADAKHAYYTGCSTGGQQGIVEAQYYPEDFDGILVGAPVINRTWTHSSAVWVYGAANLKPGHKLSDAKLAFLHKSAIAACGAKANGLKSDAFIADPSACDFSPAELTCKGAAAEDCFSPEEIETAKAFYSGPLDKTGKGLAYGVLPGSESGGAFAWSFLETPFPPGEPAFDSLFKWVFGANWDWRTFNIEQDMAKIDATLGPWVNGATTCDMSGFHNRGGKIMIYQGWADPLVPPVETVDFYKALSRQFGGKEQDFARLFMGPGYGHCGGLGGPDRFDSTSYHAMQPPTVDATHDMFTALTHWVEDGVAPAQIIATKFVDNDASKGIAMQRPLCPYPQRAWYKGSGDANDAANFVCAADKP